MSGAGRPDAPAVDAVPGDSPAPVATPPQAIVATPPPVQAEGKSVAQPMEPDRFRRCAPRQRRCVKNLFKNNGLDFIKLRIAGVADRARLGVGGPAEQLGQLPGTAQQRWLIAQRR